MDYLKDVVPWFSLIISIIALVRTHQVEVKRRRLEVAGYLNEYYRGLREWADLVIDKLSDAAFLCDCDPQKMETGQFFERRNNLLSAVSSLLDRDRLYLPNTNENSVGQWKSSSYRGLRKPALSYLAKAFGLVKSLDYNNKENNKSLQQCIVDAKRNFTSELQAALDVRKITDEVGVRADEIWASTKSGSFPKN